MPRAKGPSFDWDNANIAHIARHRVAPDEAEQVISGARLPIGSEEERGEERHTELGETEAGRLLLVIWTWRGDRVRVVTAFPANRKWRALWRRVEGGRDA